MTSEKTTLSELSQTVGRHRGVESGHSNKKLLNLAHELTLNKKNKNQQTYSKRPSEVAVLAVRFLKCCVGIPASARSVLGDDAGPLQHPICDKSPSGTGGTGCSGPRLSHQKGYTHVCERTSASRNAVSARVLFTVATFFDRERR